MNPVVLWHKNNKTVWTVAEVETGIGVGGPGGYRGYFLPWTGPASVVVVAAATFRSSSTVLSTSTTFRRWMSVDGLRPGVDVTKTFFSSSMTPSQK
jgi:hypothetical protein